MNEVDMNNKLPVVLLAGGLGTRMREETEYKPKPMIEVGGQPVLWHIMKNLSVFQLDEFIVCAGYKGEHIKNFFLNYSAMRNDFTLRLADRSNIELHGSDPVEDWSVTVADTGPFTMTGGRVNRIRKYIKGRRFLVTYGDGLANVDIDQLLEFHISHGRIATVTTVRPLSRFGVMDIEHDGKVNKFKEKPQVDDWVNIGFFIFEPEIFNYLNDDCILEKSPLEQLAKIGELYAYRHEGFWEPMDTYREYQLLNDLWRCGEAPWKTWM
jgi:glucose-1-phosphate cytidylyltransferase